MWRTGVAFAVGLLLGASPSTARAAGPAARTRAGAPARGRVAVVRAADADGASQEVAMRVIAELLATGVPVVALVCEPGDSLCGPIPGEQVLATVVVARHDEVPAIEVRPGISRGPTAVVLAGAAGPSGRGPRSMVQLAAVESPGALAVRAVELLRAILPEVADGSDEPERSAAVASVEAERASPPAVAMRVDEDDEEDDEKDDEKDQAPPSSGRLTARIGATALATPNGLSTGYGPALSLAYRTTPHLALAALLAGPTYGADQYDSSGNHVSVRQELLVVGVDLVGSLANRWTIGTGLGIGAYHLQATGHPPPFNVLPDRTTGGFSAMVTWSLSLAASLGPHVGLFIEGRLFLLTPTPVVSLNGSDVARAGDPGLLALTGVELRL